MDYEKEDSDRATPPRDAYWQIKLKLRILQEWKENAVVELADNRRRIRDLEDFRLQLKTTHKNMITWITIAATGFSAAITILEHWLFK